jgi:hypothetical protein
LRYYNGQGNDAGSIPIPAGMTQFNSTIKHTDHIARFSLLTYEIYGADRGYVI